MTSAAERWAEQVQQHHAQTERARERSGDEDFWSPIAKAFRDDPAREGDPVLNRLYGWVSADSTVLDVGGGAGRFAIPLARRCRHVTVVEPSDSMIEMLRSTAAEAGVDNITVVQEKWEDAQAEPADIVLCAHAVYGIVEIEPFLRKLADHARQRAVIVVHSVAPIAIAAPFWKTVHGEERIVLPALPELLPVLWEMDVWPDVEMLGASRRRIVDDPGMALTWLRHMTWVRQGSEKERLLEGMLDGLYDSAQGKYVLGGGGRKQGIVTWVTESAPEIAAS